MMYGKLSALAETRTKEEWQELYDNHTLKEIGVIIGYTTDARVPVKKILMHHGITLRPNGEGPTGGNRKGTGLQIPKKVLISNRTHGDIAEEYRTSWTTVFRARKRLGIVRAHPYTDEWELYNSQVRKLTEQTYRKHKDIINPHNHPRGKMGVDGAYQVDHIRPVRECFFNGVPPEECAALDNLQMISWEDNLSRRNYLPSHSLPV